jgi:hypothetical protein
MADNKEQVQSAQFQTKASETKAAETTDQASRVAQRARDDNVDRARRTGEVRKDLSRQQNEVMEQSQPTPTQEEIDRAKLGLPVDEKEQVNSPSMPGLEEQQNRVAEATTNRSGYNTRDSAARKR